ncbi:2-oxoglutarate dehydrogenase, E2 component, dihydrolipoamide succinyltransferase [Nocardia sp. XZ_19_231]|uniref:2-oxoglutarate dehydrogenase, E2 component, dihydrolipoamide succinyltransferase n=1 Tax=Nocardia sp. XZ_19_231 TaxID=2769252 RepID=UPI00188EFEB0|nr:2-oxoglutarate dehydrogenase, E2 component, dihydrolipoamide succinyltransferase [Nocardia sp. XZ_19_231]
MVWEDRAPSELDVHSMATEVTLPALGESVTEGVILRWLKEVGDAVEIDDPLLEISTDKVDTEVPSPAGGVLLEILAAVDDTVDVGAVIATIGDIAAQSVPAPDSTPHVPEPVPIIVPAVSRTERIESDAVPVDERVRATPLARRLAAEHDVDVHVVSGAVGGAPVRKRHVLDAVAALVRVPAVPVAAAAAPKGDGLLGKVEKLLGFGGRTEKLSRLRRTIAARMVESLQVSAQLTTVVEVDVTGIARLRSRHKDAFFEREGVKLSFLPFFAKAAIESLKTYPQLNSSLSPDADTVTYHAGEHLGVAVDNERGLMVPVLRDAGDLSIAGLAKGIADVAARTRAGTIGVDELSGGTFTITNTGSRGALFDTPIINQPQVAILGTGSVVKRAVVITDSLGRDAIAVRSMVYLALTYDHRIVDGADAARFLTALKHRLEGAAFESELG